MISHTVYRTFNTARRREFIRITDDVADAVREAGMAEAVRCLGSIDPVRCRASVVERYDVSLSTAGYEHVYRQAITAHRRNLSRSAQGMPERLPVPASPLS